jgi:hypothetical protein
MLFSAPAQMSSGSVFYSSCGSLMLQCCPMPPTVVLAAVLAAVPGDEEKLVDLRSKACLRRAEALAALSNHSAALEVSVLSF